MVWYKGWENIYTPCEEALFIVAPPQAKIVLVGARRRGFPPKWRYKCVCPPRECAEEKVRFQR